MLELVIAGRAFLLSGRNRVDVGGVGAVGEISARAARFVDQLFQQIVRALRAFILENALECIQPLLRFLWIRIRQRRHIHDLYPFEVEPDWGRAMEAFAAAGKALSERKIIPAKSAGAGSPPHLRINSLFGRRHTPE